MKETWKPIKGYEGAYEVSSLGNVKSVKRTIVRGGISQTINERILSPKQAKNNGYLIVGLHVGGHVRYKYIHRLVAEAFLGVSVDGGDVNHKNEVKTDNRLENLEWCSHIANVNYGTGRTRHDAAVSVPVSCYTADGTFIRSYASITEAAKEVGVLKTSVWAALSGKSKTCKGMIWKYDR